MDALRSLPYMDKNIEKSSFHSNSNHSEIPYVASNITQIIHKGLVW